LTFLAQERLNQFREYPYLYDGTIEGENDYVAWYQTLPNTAIAIAYYNYEPIGVVTGAPFVEFGQHFEGYGCCSLHFWLYWVCDKVLTAAEV